jgi:hypothetical protein
MKDYEKPSLERIPVSKTDIITASIGTETTPLPDDGMMWDLDIQ